MPRSPSLRSAPLLAAASLLLLTGCDCAGDTPRATCTNADECGDGEICVDGFCEPAPDDGIDAGPGEDAGRDDAGPGTDAGPRPDGGAPGDAGPEDASCGGEAVAFDYRPPNVLLVFDRSCSMRRRLDDTSQFGTGPEDGRTRWNTAREAVLDLLDRFGTRAFWGLMAFPDPREGCGDPVDAEVAPGPGTASMIEAALRSSDVQPFGLCGLDNSDTTTQPRQTPTEDALTSARDLSELSDPTRASFAIVVTDGGVSCGVSDAALETLAASLRDRGIPVGVIGFATGSAEGSLEAIASQGGFARPGGPPSYYVAEDRADLDLVLDEIARRVVSCELSLSSTPPDPSMLFVNVNDTPLPEDPSDGWSYDASANRLTFNGEACERLRSGDVRRINVSFGCAPVACEPQGEICNGLDDDCDDTVDEDCLF
jgi:hypothetical protein